jgi:hypothetical protein
MDELPLYRAIEDAEGWAIRGGKLSEELRYPPAGDTLQTIKQLVGFLAQYTGATLKIYRQGEKEPSEVRAYPPRSFPAENTIGHM